jgi:hypothetical protein
MLTEAGKKGTEKVEEMEKLPSSHQRESRALPSITKKRAGGRNHLRVT